MEQREEVESQTAADMLREMIEACGPAESLTTGVLHGIHWAQLECPEFKPRRKGSSKMTEQASRALAVGAVIHYQKFWFDGHYEHCAAGIGSVVEVTSTGVTVCFEQTRGAMDGGKTFFAHDEMRFCTAVGVQK